MAPKPRFRAVAAIDPAKLAEFQAGIRKRYSDEQIVAEITASAERLGRSPTMREFAADPETSVHPQTVTEHFGSWNAAKRKAGLVPRRFASREELLGLLRNLGEELGRVPTAKDIELRKGNMPRRTSSGPRSAPSTTPSRRPASTSPSARSASSAPSTRASSWPSA